MNGSSLVWGSPAWNVAALALITIAAMTLVAAYWRGTAASTVTIAAAVLKALGLAALAVCLIEPLWSENRARRGANMFAIVADNSQSMGIRDQGVAESRGQQLQELLSSESTWQQRLSDDFDVRRFVFDSHLRSVDHFSTLSLDGERTSLSATLASLTRRFRGLPVAGILLLTDGNATDDGKVSDGLPPIYPVVMGSDASAADIAVSRLSVSQSNFESAPVTIRADVSANGFKGQRLIAKLFDAGNSEVQSQTVEVTDEGQPLALRFQLRPPGNDVSFYRVRVVSDADANQAVTETPTSEATAANNERLAVVDRSGGPYRVLYVCGKPNWEFKFLRRALADDDQLALVGLVRIARREPKFKFRARGEETNPLFTGFGHPDEESAERYDQPVLVRLGTEDDQELRDGFPKSADQLYRYDAVILDDVEADFFSPDQLALLQNFVSRRGGGMLMLGGPESFAGGRYARSPVGNLLPVYTDEELPPVDPHEYRLALSREGWLQPWVRMRQTEPEERQRLASMTTFRGLSRVGRLKPAATVLATVVDEAGTEYPALVTQRFGAGRTAALMIGDLWRWGMRRQGTSDDDLSKSWRQTVRWLVADVPRRVEVDVRPQPDSEVGKIAVKVRVRDAEYLPLDNARVAIEVTAPDGKRLELDAEPTDNEAGAYQATYVPRQPGAYRASVAVSALDGSSIGEREAGWVAQPAADEFNSLRPNRAWLENVAAKTGGEVVAIGDLDRFAANLPSRKAPITEPWVRPLWHHPLFYASIIACLTAEWGLRRWRGLA